MVCFFSIFKVHYSTMFSQLQMAVLSLATSKLYFSNPDISNPQFCNRQQKTLASFFLDQESHETTNRFIKHSYREVKLKLNKATYSIAIHPSLKITVMFMSFSR